jgi:serine/threonine protein kinase
MASACSYFHHRGIVHRDLKLENVLFKRKPEFGDLTVKIVDFGIAGSSNPNKAEKSNAGSLSYMPPEVLDNTCTVAETQIDIWALGVILFAMIMG